MEGNPPRKEQKKTTTRPRSSLCFFLRCASENAIETSPELEVFSREVVLAAADTVLMREAVSLREQPGLLLCGVAIFIFSGGKIV